ncbi:sulfurtransferase [Streptomyces sp. NPDC090306]|uniref:sulfurtransferase n=1 Tax=Streptomyces sp. NPDC090306 TaxID=3365961 RepID=UPI0037FA9BF9
MLIDVPGLRALLARSDAERTAGGQGVLLLDTTVSLASPEHDGDYRAASGAAGWAAAGIPGSRHVDLLTRFTDPAAHCHFTHPSREAVRRELAELGATEDTEVVLYDRGPLQWAARLWWTLRDAGVRARVLDGGLPAWTRAGQPVRSQHPYPEAESTPPRTPADAEAHAAAPHSPERPEAFPRAAAGDATRPSLWADKDQVAAVSEGLAPGTLVCALSAEHFEGTTPTRYSRRGRIPGSVSLPAQPVLGPAGTIRTDPELAAYADRLPVRREGPVILYCGGGISASLGALALTLAGVGELALYDGSLEEWTADPARRVLTGAP